MLVHYFCKMTTLEFKYLLTLELQCIALFVKWPHMINFPYTRVVILFKTRIEHLVNGIATLLELFAHAMTDNIWYCSFIIIFMSRFSKMAYVLFSKLGIGTFISPIVDIEENLI